MKSEDMVDPITDWKRYKFISSSTSEELNNRAYFWWATNLGEKQSQFFRLLVKN